MPCRLSVLFAAAALAFAKTPRPLPDLLIHTPDSRKIDLKKYRGHAVALMIFSTECSSCVTMLRFMDKMQTELGPQGLQVIGVAGDDDARTVLAPFLMRYRPSFPVGFLNKDEIIKIADIGQGVRPVAPILLFIDRWGEVREQYFGDHPIFSDPNKNIRALCNAMLRVAPVGTRER